MHGKCIVNNLFITGMGRSGTTLLDRLLTNHKIIDVLSQPFPLIFIEAKRRFLREKGIDKYYVLNDDLISRNYPQEEFNAYLNDFEISMPDIENIFKKMENYSGQCVKRDHQSTDDESLLHGYNNVYEKCLEFYKVDKQATYLGVKEPMCEEFLPYLCENGYKSIVIIRDPRDVLASANYPKKVKYLGGKKPALFILRTWRKSAEYINSLKKNKNFYFLCYEDLVSHPYQELDRITDFLGVERFSPVSFEEGVFDRGGEPWLPNTSFELGETFISKKSKGIYTDVLSDEEIAYTEAVCGSEMEWFGYPVSADRNKRDIIMNFKDRDVADHVHLRADFSSQPGNVATELERVNIDEYAKNIKPIKAR